MEADKSDAANLRAKSPDMLQHKAGLKDGGPASQQKASLAKNKANSLTGRDGVDQFNKVNRRNISKNTQVKQFINPQPTKKEMKMSQVGHQQAENQRAAAEMIPSLGEHHNMSVDEARLNGTQIKRQSSKLHRRSQTTHEQMHAPAAMAHMTYEQNATHQSKLMDPAAIARNHNNSHFEG